MKLPSKLGPTLIDFIKEQPMFFVATAAPTGRVNMSPKGMDSLRVISPTHIQWLNVSGSGNETAAHLRESSRMTLMWCAFKGDAKILRVFGTATVMHQTDKGWDEALAHFPKMAGSRNIFDLTIDAVRVSCGTGVPEMTYQTQRGPTELLPFFDDMGHAGVENFWTRKNLTSVDDRPTGLADHITKSA